MSSLAHLSQPRTLVLLRHGESTANASDTFGGWLDFPLTERGRQQAVVAADLMARAKLLPEVVFTSVLSRAIDTARIVADQTAPVGISTHSSWRLNERHYGQLQGRSRAEVCQQFGYEQFAEWRRAYQVAPPAIGTHDPTHPRTDPRYAALSESQLPVTESLAAVSRRLVPYWQNAIAPHVSDGQVTLVVAHGNSLRALRMHLDSLSPDEVRSLHIPTGAPLRYDLDSDLVPLVRGGAYLDPEAAAPGIAAVAAEGRR